MSKTTEDIRKTNKTEPAKVQAGHLMAIIYYVTVENTAYNGERLTVKDVVGDTGKIDINGKSLIETALSADQFQETVKVNRTQLAQLLIESHNRPFTVVFDKQESKDGKDKERKLRGRLISHEALLGRSLVEDLDIDAKDPKGRTRLVDHRTLKSLIVDGVKYELK
jgi:hypothetical protein